MYVLNVLFFLIGLSMYSYCDASVPIIRPAVASFNMNGSITGTILPGYRTPFIEGFLGIPFAEPPVDNLRFSDPLPFRDFWSHDHIANEERQMCLQKNYMDPTGGSPQIYGIEDCLYLNIYRPVGIPSDRLVPVIFQIHGGAFIVGSPSPASLGPKYFMDHGDVILVTPTYRLGPLGFLSTGDNEMPGNFAFKDQAMALRWVKENIILFSGNPNQITVSGQSAGGTSSHLHLISPLSSNLFNRLITASGTATSPFVYVNEDPLSQARELARSVGIENFNTLTTAELAVKFRAIDPIIILNAADIFRAWSIDPLAVFLPVVEDSANPNAFLVEDPRESLANGNYKMAPILMSIVPEEGVVRTSSVLPNAPLLENLNKNFDFVIGIQNNFRQDDPELESKIDQVVDFYFNGSRNIGWHNAQRYTDMYGDRFFTYPYYSCYKFHSKTANPLENPLYLMEFNYRGPYSFSSLLSGTNIDFGVVHGDDLIYLFDHARFNLFDFDSPEANLINEMINIYVNFASGRLPHEKSTICTFDEANPDEPCETLYIVNSDNNAGYEVQTTNRFDMEMVNFWRRIDRQF